MARDFFFNNTGQGISFLTKLANTLIKEFGVYTISRGKHYLAEIYYSVGGSGEGPLIFFALPKPSAGGRVKGIFYFYFFHFASSEGRWWGLKINICFIFYFMF